MNEVEMELNALHFERALQLIEKNGETDPAQKCRALRGLNRFKETEVCAEDLPLELAKAQFSQGRIEEAMNLLKEHKDDSAEYSLAYAGGLAETGKVKEAKQVLSSINKEKLSRLSQMDALILEADIESFLEHEATAVELYKYALEKADELIPANWVHLRKMLVWQNLADTWEQAEDEQNALAAYREGLRQLEAQHNTDTSVTDLSGYEIEFLLSMANCYGNAEDFEKAQHYLSVAAELLKSHPPFQKKYFEARLAYISGLIAVNDGLEDTAEEYFSKALNLQKELVACGQDKPEHLARTAYYLGTLLDDERVHEKEELFSVAYPVFEGVYEKEPAFYGGGMADMDNELGRLTKDSSLLKRAISRYETLVKAHPDDLLGLSSLVIARINLAMIGGVLDEGVLRKELHRLKVLGSPDLDMITGALEQVDVSDGFADWLDSFRKNLPARFAA